MIKICSFVFACFIPFISWSAVKIDNKKLHYSLSIGDGWIKEQDNDDYLSYKKANATIGISVDKLNPKMSFDEFIKSAIKANEPHGFVPVESFNQKLKVNKKEAFRFRMHMAKNNQVFSLTQTSIKKDRDVLSIKFFCNEPNCEELKKEYLKSIDTLKY